VIFSIEYYLNCSKHNNGKVRVQTYRNATKIFLCTKQTKCVRVLCDFFFLLLNFFLNLNNLKRKEFLFRFAVNSASVLKSGLLVRRFNQVCLDEEVSKQDKVAKVQGRSHVNVKEAIGTARDATGNAAKVRIAGNGTGNNHLDYLKSGNDHADKARYANVGSLEEVIAVHNAVDKVVHCHEPQASSGKEWIT